MARDYYVDRVEFTNDGAATVRVRTPATEADKYERTETFDVRPEHARALTRFLGQECLIYILPMDATFSQVVGDKAAP